MRTPPNTSGAAARGSCRIAAVSSTFYAIESILFDRPMFGENLFVNQRYDDIWMIPQVANISAPYFEVLGRQTAQVVHLEPDVPERVHGFLAAFGRVSAESGGRVA